MGQRGTVVGFGSATLVVRLDEPIGTQWTVTFLTRGSHSHTFQMGDRVVWLPDYEQRNRFSSEPAMADRIVRESELVPAEVAFLEDRTPLEEHHDDASHGDKRGWSDDV